MTKSTIAKALASLGGTLSTLGLAGTFGSKWSAAAASVGGALVAIAAALASSTSAGHPNG